MLETCGNIIYLGDAKETTGGGGTGGVSDHNDLTGRSALNQHPIKAISGLEDKLTEIENKIPENLTTQGNEFNNANQLVKLSDEGKLPAIDGSNLLNLPTGPSSTSSYGIKGDYFSKYGITKCQNGLIKTTLDSKEVVVLAGIECFMPGATTKITIASNITYEVQATTKTTLFLAGAEIIEAEDVFYQETEPEDGSSTYVAWYNPKANEWKFKSNDTGNVFRTVRATPIADVYVDGSNITRIDYIGYRVFNDTIYATKDDLDTVSNSLSTKQDALTTDQLKAINSGITEDNFNELNTEVETIKNDQETLGNDLGTLSNTVGLKDDLPDTSKSITQNISSISTKVSGLIKDDESSATTTYSSSKILNLIGDIHTFDVLVVDALPDAGVEKTIYFVPATTTKDQNIYDEYLYINNAWELIGSTQVDLSDYLKIDGSNGTETGINTLLNLISAGEDDILDSSNILFENTAFKKKTALSFVNYLKGKIIDDTTASTSTVYSSSKIEEINTQVWSGTTSEFEALDKTTLKDGQVVNITDDYDEPTASFAKFPSLKVPATKALKITRNREVSGILKICDVYGNIYLAGIGDRASRFYMKCLLNDIPSSKNIATFSRNTTAMFICSTPYPFFLLEVLGDLSYEIIEKDDIPTDATAVDVDNI